MEFHFSHNQLHSFPISKSITTPLKWFKQWVSQDVVATGGQCRVLKWVNEAMIKTIREKNELEIKEAEPEPTTEVVFLCSNEGCGFTCTDAKELRRHSQTHGERQYICHYEGCGKKYFDGAKLKRHLLLHTGRRDSICPHKGCGKPFSSEFDLRAHIKMHSLENYHTCLYPGCGKSYAHEYRLKKHIAEHHEKNAVYTLYHTPSTGKPQKTPKSVWGAYGSASSDRPYVCPYDDCEKAYIQAYKLNLHLRREHPGHFLDENAENTRPSGNEIDKLSDHDALLGKHRNSKSVKHGSRTKQNLSRPPSKVARRNVSSSSSGNLSKAEKHSPAHEGVSKEEDSEETEDEMDNAGD